MRGSTNVAPWKCLAFAILSQLFSGISFIGLLFQTIILKSEVVYESMRVLLASFEWLPWSNPLLKSVLLAVDLQIFSL